VWPVTLSGRLPVKALVGHYPTNKLIGREHIPHQNPPKEEPFPTTPCGTTGIPGISHPFRQLSRSEGQITHVLLTRSPLEYPQRGLSARLACVKHAASVRPEPGSNSPSKTKLHRNREKTLTNNDQLANNRQNHHSSTQKNQPPHPQKHEAERTEVQQTNQKNVDKHTVEFSKIRRAPDRPRKRRSRGQP
jgi:hypothetical protein